MKEIVRLISDMEERRAEIKRDINKLRTASRENYLTVYDYVRNKYDEFPGIDTLRESGKQLIESRIKSFFKFLRTRQKTAHKSRLDDLILRETCCLIEIAAWNCYAGAYTPGIRFRNFLSTYSSCTLFQAEYIWLLYRNVIIHIGDLPVKTSFEDLSFHDLNEIFNECMDDFENECMEKCVDPAPVIYRQLDLIETKIKILKGINRELDPPDADLFREMLALKYL